MPAGNTHQRYGSAAMIFHWLVALLMLIQLPLGVAANRLAVTPNNLELIFLLFSLHKTLGVLIFAAAVLRIIWAVSQPKPRPLHPERRLESFLAATIHWVLYGALIAVPVTGWAEHAAMPGLAPILWPFGQSFAFVPADPDLAERFAALHRAFVRLLVAALLLHIAGALKHALIDHDVTLGRMLPGQIDVPELPPDRASYVPPFAALAAFVLVFLLAFGLPSGSKSPGASADTDLVPNWTIESGELAITVRQFGAEIRGSFEDWSAEIDFDPERPGPEKGRMRVNVGVASLDLGDITARVLGPEFLEAANYPSARYEGTIAAENGDYRVDGALYLKEQTQPVPFSFMLRTVDGRAEVTGEAVVDRRDFGVGTKFLDETVVGFPVDIRIRLTARSMGG